MSDVASSAKLIAKKTLFFLILSSVAVLPAILPQITFAQDETVLQQEAMQQMAQQLLQVATEQHRRGTYKAAEESLYELQQYVSYLPSGDQKKVNSLIEQNNLALSERETILTYIEKSRQFEGQKDFAAAKASLEKVKGSKYLTQAEQKQIQSDIIQLEEKAKMQALAAPESQNTPATGTPVTIEDELTGVQVEATQIAPAQPEQTTIKPATSAETQPTGGYLDTVVRNRTKQRDYIRAVVADTADKAQKYTAAGEFERANQKIADTTDLVNKNSLVLGDSLYKQHNETLNQLKAKMTAEQERISAQQSDLKHKEAQQAQKTLRQQQETERDERINSLMDNALAYQKQQRYEEALGQVDILLGIDPQNAQAQTLKLTLQDVIYYRKQFDTQKKADDESENILLETEKSAIPYADEITYPKNWRQLISRRQAEQVAGLDPMDAAVYKQLDQITDLSSLTPETAFGDALETLRTSVEPPLKLFPLWRDLSENAYIEPTTPINMQGISAIPLKKGMDLLLKSVAGGLAELDYVVGDGIITIATKGSTALPSKLERRVYNIKELVGSSAGFVSALGGAAGAGGGGGGGGATSGGGNVDKLLDTEQIEENLEALVQTLQDVVEPESWYAAGGQGTIKAYKMDQLIVNQTPEIHSQISKLLLELRKSFGQQVSIEARFIVVGENFLEDIGLDFDIKYTDNQKLLPILAEDETSGELVPVLDEFGRTTYGVADSGDSRQDWDLLTDTRTMTSPADTQVTGTFSNSTVKSWDASGSIILDNLQLDLLLRATKAHREARQLNAPKVTVLDNESATMQVIRTRKYITDYSINVENITVGNNVVPQITADPTDDELQTGTVLNITPTISPDKKYVLLRITTWVNEFLGFQEYPIVIGGETGLSIFEPDTEISEVRTRVSVPDRGTLLLGGQKITVESEKEAGVPVLSQIPLVGRLFTSRSTVKDQKILLILVTPTIILQNEAEADAIAGMDTEYKY